MFLGLLAKLADPIPGHLPQLLAGTRAQRRANRSRRQVLTSYARTLGL